MQKKYHKQVYFDSSIMEFIKVLLAGLTFYPSRHFSTAMLRRQLPFPTRRNLLEADIFEYTTIDGKLEKFCVRCALSDTLHYCYSISVRGYIITGWKNKAEDLHFTLQKGKYCEE